ncbi:hydroxyacid dehydrogenase [Oscillibacter sp. GMB15532]|uniref:hydroxyacid dehydrogenase n=1 Tax=Oscillibacter sp. GMB15532 TaxID=3230022 RepID=UPI0034DE9969
MRHRVLLVEPTIQPVGVDILKAHCEVFMACDGTEDTLIQKLNEHQAEGIITRVEHITHRILEKCPSLRVIQQHGTGMDNIDIFAATAHGVRVQNVPDGNYISVAEHVVMSILALSRNLIQADAAVRQGNWNYREIRIPHEIAEKTLLIIGLGRIGRSVAKKAQAFDMQVIGFDPFVSAEQMEGIGVKKIETLDNGLSEADYVTIQLHLTLETEGMISTAQLHRMKNTAALINLSRGPVVDQEALYAALRDHKIAAAALDVFEKEPPEFTDPLFSLPNVILTPHFGGDTWEAKQRLAKKAAENLILALDGVDTYNWANRTAMEEAGTVTANSFTL